jgi:hypothetical protein
MKTKLIFDFSAKPHARALLEHAFARHNAASVELPMTLYCPSRGLKMSTLTRCRRFTWLPAFECVERADMRLCPVQTVRATITRKRGRWTAEMQLLAEPTPVRAQRRGWKERAAEMQLARELS